MLWWPDHRDTLGELIVLPRLPSWIKGGTKGEGTERRGWKGKVEGRGGGKVGGRMNLLY